MDFDFLGRSEDSVNHPQLIQLSNNQISGFKRYMERENKNNRSLLALAGQQSLSGNQNGGIPLRTEQKNKKLELSRSIMVNPSYINLQNRAFDQKDIIKKLGLARLRKMQALVRGFITRRTIYPKQLKKYLIAQSVLDIIVANAVYKECSGLIVQTVALGRYDREELGEQRLLEEYLYNVVIRRVVEKELQPIAKEAVYQSAMFASRPNITFGFNLRDPLELILYQKLQQIIMENSREVAEQSLREEALERRHLQVVDSWIGSLDLLNEICFEVVNECLLEQVEEYVLESMFAKMVKEVSVVVAEVVYNQTVAAEQDKFLLDLAIQAEEWVLQEAVVEVLKGALFPNQSQ